jgi:hypothetical protein
MALEHEEITREIIGAAYEVYRVLGYGFWKRSINVRCKLNFRCEA